MGVGARGAVKGMLGSYGGLGSVGSGCDRVSKRGWVWLGKDIY